MTQQIETPVRNQGRVSDAVEDITEALRKYDLAALLGWQDVAQRYRRSRLGAFWLTANIAVMICALGAIFGAVLRQDMNEFLPYMAASMILWTFISTTLNEGCSAFVQSESIILQVRVPLFTHILRFWWRNAIIFAHNILILPFVVVFYGHFPFLYWIVAIPGLILISVNLLWMSLFLSVLCARYRDMSMVVQNILQMLFYATPIIWLPSSLPDGSLKTLLLSSPFYHLMQVVREPLLGRLPTLLDWGVVIAMAVVGWCFTLVFFGNYRKRVSYWL